MKRWCVAACLFVVLAGARAQQKKDDNGTVILTARTNLVLVPALAKTRKGDVLFNLSSRDFSLTDNGVPQQLTIDPDTGSQPLALVICVQTGGAARGHLEDYRRLGPMLDALLGGVERRVAVVGFDSFQRVLMPFGPDADQAALTLTDLEPGDSGAAILDGVAFAVSQLRTQPTNYRRAILLLSETIDGGSKTDLDEALRLISNTNTMLYSFAFSSTRAALSHEADKFGYNHSTGPGPAHGCFSRDGADAEYDGHYSRQVLDCLSQLAPPLRLATMAFLTARNGLRTNTAASLAQLTGGEFFRFDNAKQLRERLSGLMHDVHNYYILSFRPDNPTPALHSLHLEVKGHDDVTVKFRPEYWVEEARE